jgi:transcriptional regulator with XRE-family HTH domain
VTRSDVSNHTRSIQDGVGDRLRAARDRVGISQRELARRLGVSPSLISQLENGQSLPSVGTLYGIVTELDVSLDEIIRGDERRAGDGAPEPAESRELRVEPRSPLVHPGERQAIDLASGVRWEELTADTEGDVDFIHATYEIGGASTPDEALIRHHGREYGYVIKGTLGVQIGFQYYELNPGDSIACDSTLPHRLFNTGDVPVEAIWFVLGRGADSRRKE